MRFRYVIWAAAFAVLASACGSDDPPTVVEPTPTEPAGAVSSDAPTDGAVAGPGDVPNLQMVDVYTDAAVDLQAVVDGSTPLLFWFWAPH